MEVRTIMNYLEYWYYEWVAGHDMEDVNDRTSH